MRKISESTRPDGSLQEIYESNLYHVMVIHDTAGNVGQIMIRRHDWSPLVDWRDKQEIKSQIAGPGAEAIEIFPAESRLVDCANWSHLWVLPCGAKFPYGYDKGCRDYSPSRGQRPEGQRSDASV